MELLVIETSEIIVTKAELNFDDTEFREVAEKIAETIKSQEFDEDKIPEQKKYVANVRKMSKMVADKRKEVIDIASGNIKEEVAKMQAVEKLLSDAALSLSSEIKNFEELQKQNKKAEIKAMFDEGDKHDFLKFEDFFIENMLNKGRTTKSIANQLEAFIQKVDNDLNIINGFDPDGETLQYYIQHKDLSKAMQEKKTADDNKRIAEEMKLKREEEQRIREEKQVKEEQEHEALDEADAEEEFEFVDIFEEEQEEVNNKAMKLKEEIESKEKKSQALADEIERLLVIKKDFDDEIETLKQELNRELGL